MCPDLLLQYCEAVQGELEVSSSVCVAVRLTDCCYLFTTIELGLNYAAEGVVWWWGSVVVWWW